MSRGAVHDFHHRLLWQVSGNTELRQVSLRIHQLLGAGKDPRHTADVAQIDVADPLPPLLAAGGVEYSAPPSLAVEFKEALDRQARFPEQVVQIILVPVQNFELRLALLEVIGARQRR